MRAPPSWRSSLLAIPASERARAISELTEAEAQALMHDWEAWARPSQQYPPGRWSVWLALAGRGWGKTRVGAETVRRWAMREGRRRIALVGRTAADVREVMVDGESGILAVSPPGERPLYEPSKRRLTWPNGAIATTYSAEEPDQLRGPQHDGAWADELAAWQYVDAWDQLQFGLRLGTDPRCIVTTTPRPTELIRSLVKDEATHVTRGSTFENRENLAPKFLREVERRYSGTLLGRQELNGEVIDEAPGALWRGGEIHAHRVRAAPDLVRIVVAVDPTVRLDEGGDECGIVVVGLGSDGCAYVLDDRSGYYSARDWPAIVVAAMRDHRADYVVAEANQGGGLVKTTIEAAAAASGRSTFAVRLVHATRGKLIRAEPVAQLAQQGRVRHVGIHSMLEAQLTTWEPGHESPGRLDALVWGVTDLIPGIGDPIETTPRPVRRDAGMSALAGLAGIRR